MLRHLHWRIALPFLILILLATLGLTTYLSNQVRQVRLEDLENQLTADARLLADRYATLTLENPEVSSPNTLALRSAGLLNARITIIAPDGTVQGESHKDSAQMDNHRNRPEVVHALADGYGMSIRYSATMGYEMMYVAVPVTSATDETTGIMRVALPLDEIEANVGKLRRNIALAGVVTALIAALLSVFIARRTTQPLRQLTGIANDMAGGNLQARSISSRRDEIGQLTRAFNHMAEQIREKVSILAEEQDRSTAVLDHMADGVLITDHRGMVKLINRAAARILQTSGDQAVERTFAQVAPYYQLIDLWNMCHENGQEQTAMVEVSRHNLFLQAIISPFEEGGTLSYLIILQDLTRVQRLETIRRDFISNISHELRTPLAGLKAIVETLNRGAIKDKRAAKRFLKRMDIEVDTLTQMVEELLQLSRLESGKVPLELRPTKVPAIIIPPVDRLRPQAERAALSLDIAVKGHIPAVNADLERLQIVVTNLVHNAIKFTNPGGHIVVSVKNAENEVIISVQDDGVGIPADDVPRIFERFYKADRARSGGGTGLGLAIAKHIIQGHNGSIWVESVEGKGSTFSFSLPVA
ncbi:MAG: ATP-binding protein [Anaerolineae bacterium]|nr:ATP-binding protein [Anaerolineae bacterium]